MADPTVFLEALRHASRESELHAVVLPALRDACATCMGYFFAALEAGQAPNDEILCRVLGKMLQVPEVKHLATEREDWAGALARSVSQHPSVHEVQVNGQWALAQLIGIRRTWEVAQQHFSSPETISAFVWTAAETTEELDWETQRRILLSGMEIITGDVASEDGQLQVRCFELVGAKLGADNVVGSIAESAERQQLAAESTEVLAQAILRCLSKRKGRLPALKAAEALWKVCRGSSEEPICNPLAQQRLASLESTQQVLGRALHADQLQDEQLQSPLQRYLLDLLGVTNGLPSLAKLLHGRDFGLPETFQWSILKVMEQLSDCRACDAADAISAVLQSVGPKPSPSLLEQAVKTLARLLEAIRSQASCSTPSIAIASAIRCAAERVFSFIVEFSEARDGRWPTMSATALKAAAFADEASRDALAKNEKLRAAAEQRMDGACKRHDNHSYLELESTFKLAVLLWGTDYVLSMLQQMLAQHAMDRQAKHYFVQAACRVLANEENEEMDVGTSLFAVKTALQIFEMLQDLPPQSLGPIATLLGRSLSALGDAGAAEVDVGSTVLVTFMDRVLALDNIHVVNEVCWGMCLATQGGLAQVTALATHGAIDRLEALAEKLATRAAQETYKRRDEAPALTEVLEALGRLRGHLGPVLAVMQRCSLQSVQVACLRALMNLLDDGLRATSQEDHDGVIASCRAVLERFGDDERIRSSAERILGLHANLRNC